MENFAGKNQGEVLAAVMAMQHILVKKGICSFTELSAANSEAQALVSKLTQTFAEGNTDASEMIVVIRSVAKFVGGDAVIPSLDQTFGELEKIISKELE